MQKNVSLLMVGVGTFILFSNVRFFIFIFFFKGGCACDGGWSGLQCRTCQDRSASCGLFQWDAEACQCSTQCKDAALCLHGSKMDPKTCKCLCNEKLMSSIATLASSSSSSTLLEQKEQKVHQQQHPRLRSGATTATTPPTSSLLSSSLPSASSASSSSSSSSSYMKLLPSWITQLPTSFLSMKEERTNSLPIAGDQLINARTVIAQGSSDITFWSGHQCERCVVPFPLPCIPGHSFDTKTCQCAAKCPIEIDCKNGGKLIPSGCVCSCAGGWTGEFCELPADGTTKERAASSCQTILETAPTSASGVYWLVHPTFDTKGSAPFQVVCDMVNDGGGWTAIASIGAELSKRTITSMDYTRGINNANAGDGGEFVTNCQLLNGLDGDATTPLKRFVLRVTMGSVRDYYRPTTKRDLCYLLTHNNGFEWSPTAGGMASSLSSRALKLLEGAAEDWVVPLYTTSPQDLELLGGSNETWPMDIDGRQYLSMWGSAKAPGGCCHYESKLYTKDVNQEGLGTADVGGWGKTFRLDVIELPDIQDSSNDPLEIVEENDAAPEDGASGGAGENGEPKEVDVKSSNVEKKNDLRSELSNEEQTNIQNKENAASENKKEFEGLDDLFS